MARSVVWAEPAVQDLIEAIRYLQDEAGAPGAATALYDEARRAAASLDQNPERGRAVPELDRTDRREIFVHRYRLVYRVDQEVVVILRLIHGRRDFRAAFRRARA